MLRQLSLRPVGADLALGLVACDAQSLNNNATNTASLLAGVRLYVITTSVTKRVITWNFGRHDLT
ncbi:MAG: hypothetical protein ACKPKO_08230, partial [Candidatus Fonsibacter sp.]